MPDLSRILSDQKEAAPTLPMLRMQGESELQALSEQYMELMNQKKERETTTSGMLPKEAGIAMEKANADVLKGKYRKTQDFGNVNPGLYGGITKGSRHLGMDLATPKGTQVYSPVAGKVQLGEDKDWGKYARVVGDDGTIYQFSHLSDYSQVPEKIDAGTLLGLTGNTGNSTGAHLDISVQRNGQYVNPLVIEAFRRIIAEG